ncbi:hypothetical protein [Sphingomonas sp. PB4P5]|uniref:hypothetical protein n=1 Tax=Parasphingomonas puruogangriensis TaxID=3096155 RepID=UPI002FC969E6
MIGRLATGLAAAVTMLLAGAPLQARGVAPANAPAAWLRYAEAATQEISVRLQAESDAAVRLRRYLDGTRPAPDQPATPLLLKIWVNRQSVVTRIEAPSFAQDEPNADLRSLILGQRLPGSPPRGIILPLRIAISLDRSRADATRPAAR